MAKRHFYWAALSLNPHLAARVTLQGLFTPILMHFVGRVHQMSQSLFNFLIAEITSLTLVSTTQEGFLFIQFLFNFFLSLQQLYNLKARGNLLPLLPNFCCFNLYSQLAGLFPAVCTSLVTGSLQSSRLLPDRPYWGNKSPKGLSLQDILALKAARSQAQKANDKEGWLFCVFHDDVSHPRQTFLLYL